MPGITPRYIGARDTAIYLGFGDSPSAVQALYQWVHRGYIPAIRVGRTLRFDVKDLDRVMAKMKEESRVA